MTEREPGFYWVKFVWGWEIANWSGFDWDILGNDIPVKDFNFLTIGPRIEKPEELT